MKYGRKTKPTTTKPMPRTSKPANPGDFHEYRAKDTELNKLSTERDDLRKKHREAVYESMEAMSKAFAYLRSARLVEKSCDFFEITDREADAAVHNITGMCPEVLCEQHDEVKDELFQLMFTKAEVAVLHNVKANALDKEYKDVHKKLGERHDKVFETWRELKNAFDKSQEKEPAS
jgi:hypothetical protein